MVMPVTMTVQRDRIHMVMHSVTMNMVMHVTIISMVMNSLAKTNTNMNNPVTMVMPVTMTVQRDRVKHADALCDHGHGNACDDYIYGDELCGQNEYQHEQPGDHGNACDDEHSKR